MPNWVMNKLEAQTSPKRYRQICEFVKSDENDFDFEKIIPMPDDVKHLAEESWNDFFRKLYLTYFNEEIIPDFEFVSQPKNMSDEQAKSVFTWFTNRELKDARCMIESHLKRDNAPSWMLDMIRDKENVTDIEVVKVALQYGLKYEYNRLMYGFETWYGWSIEYWGTKWNAVNSFILENFGQWKFETAWAAPIPVIRTLSMIFPDVTFTLEYADEDIGNNCGVIEFKDGTEKMTFGEGCTVESRIEFALRLWDIDKDEWKKEMRLSEMRCTYARRIQ